MMHIKAKLELAAKTSPVMQACRLPICKARSHADGFAENSTDDLEVSPRLGHPDFIVDGGNH